MVWSHCGLVLSLRQGRFHVFWSLCGLVVKQMPKLCLYYAALQYPSGYQRFLLQFIHKTLEFCPFLPSSLISCEHTWSTCTTVDALLGLRSFPFTLIIHNCTTACTNIHQFDQANRPGRGCGFSGDLVLSSSKPNSPSKSCLTELYAFSNLMGSRRAVS